MAEYIDREALLQEISKQKAASKHSFPRRSFVVGDVIACIRTAPAADVAPVVHGRWESCFEDWRQQIEGSKCSVCGYEHYAVSILNYNYCPRCGARMDGDADE